MFASDETDVRSCGQSLAELNSLAAYSSEATNKYEALWKRLEVAKTQAKLKATCDDCFLESLRIQQEKMLKAAELRAPTPPVSHTGTLPPISQASQPPAAGASAVVQAPLHAQLSQAVPTLRPSVGSLNPVQNTAAGSQPMASGIDTSISSARPLQEAESQGGWVEVQGPQTGLNKDQKGVVPLPADSVVVKSEPSGWLPVQSSGGQRLPSGGSDQQGGWVTVQFGDHNTSLNSESTPVMPNLGPVNPRNGNDGREGK